MDLLSGKRYKLFSIALLVMAVMEILSYAVFLYRPWGNVVFGIIVLIAFVLTIKNLKFGLLILVGELVIGSQGYLFSLDSGGSRLSLRIALWIIVMAAWAGAELLNLLRHQNIFKKYAGCVHWKPLALLGLSLLVAAFVGYVSGNDSTYFFLEGKRWLFALVIIPIIGTFQKKEDINALLQVIAAGAVALCLQTLGLVYLFSHPFIPFVYTVYDWMRFSLLGEITRFSGGFYRIFMQSQIFLLPAYCGLLVCGLKHLFIRQGRPDILGIRIAIATAAFGTVIVASLSRSFWVAVAGALGIAGFTAVLVFRPKISRILGALVYTACIGLVTGVLLFAVVRFPFPKSSAEFDASLFADRATQGEAGSASRWSLLPVMWQEIEKSPLIGYGFGKTMTYTTSDPRITQSTVNGQYTTYAFEWGWFDIWLKLGILGVIAYLWLFLSLLGASKRLLGQEPLWALVLGMAVISLAATHFFTPYLNHPLGFAYVAFIMVLLRSKSGGLSKA